MGTRLFCALSCFFRIDFRKSVRTIFKFPMFYNLGKAWEGIFFFFSLKEQHHFGFLRLFLFWGAGILSRCSSRAAGGVWPGGFLGPRSDKIKVVLWVAETGEVCKVRVGKSPHAEAQRRKSE